ncbi:hypothetical protein SB767_33205, partial [Bacillus sp. SIMBA_069]
SQLKEVGRELFFACFGCMSLCKYFIEHASVRLRFSCAGIVNIYRVPWFLCPYPPRKNLKALG